MLRTLFVFVTMLIVSASLSIIVIVASLFGARYREGGLVQWAGLAWPSAWMWAAGARVRLHGTEFLQGDGARIFVGNHISWYDIFAMAVSVPRFTFVAKAELEKIPLLARACRHFGIVFLPRQNRKAAFAAYDVAAKLVEQGRSVIVFPEGTRGYDYPLRPFKKGPFVLAISAGVPIVPTIIHGSMDIQRKGEPWIRAGTMDIRFLEPIDTSLYNYERREELMRVVWERMAAGLREHYGVESDRGILEKGAQAPKIPTSFF